MGSATAQLIGNVATDLKKSLENQGHERVSFRVIANDRRRDAAGIWVDGDEFAVTVVCWGALARGVAHSVKLGDPVLVSGRLVTRRYEVEGETKYITELKANVVGHDLSRGAATFQRQAPGQSAEPADSAERSEPAIEEILAAVG
jgi:single-strand DNA-binding protein